MRRLFFFSAYVLYGGGFVVTVLGAALWGKPLSYLEGSPTDSGTWVVAARRTALGLGTGGAIVVAGFLASRFSKWLESLEREFALLLFWIRGWPDIFVLALLSSLAEEAFFRGLLQPYLGLVGTSIAFALCHPPLSRRLVAWPIFAFSIGLVLGYLFDTTRENLLAPTALHFVVNFLNLRLILRHARQDPV
jgi:membrane protease YdiL (CAAX protease family)